MFQANCEQTVYVGGALKVTFGGIENTPDENGNVTVNAVLNVEITVEGYHATMDKTYREIQDAYLGGRFVCFYWVGDNFYSSVTALGWTGSQYAIWENSGAQFEADTMDDYPTATWN